MAELLAAMQKHLAGQGSHAGHSQLPLAGMPFTPSVGQKAVHHHHQQQQQQQPPPPPQQQQQQQQWQSNGTMASEQQQGQQQQQTHWQGSGPQAMWPDPTTASVLQHLLQQSRAPRSWAPAPRRTPTTYRLRKLVTSCYMLYLPVDVKLRTFSVCQAMLYLLSLFPLYADLE